MVGAHHKIIRALIREARKFRDCERFAVELMRTMKPDHEGDSLDSGTGGLELSLADFIRDHCQGRIYDSCFDSPCMYASPIGCAHPKHP